MCILHCALLTKDACGSQAIKQQFGSKFAILFQNTEYQAWKNGFGRSFDLWRHIGIPACSGFLDDSPRFDHSVSGFCGCSALPPPLDHKTGPLVAREADEGPMICVIGVKTWSRRRLFRPAKACFQAIRIFTGFSSTQNG